MFSPFAACNYLVIAAAGMEAFRCASKTAVEHPPVPNGTTDFYFKVLFLAACPGGGNRSQGVPFIYDY